jgi:hypothetical protein
METVKISPDCQVVIPKKIRDALERESRRATADICVRPVHSATRPSATPATPRSIKELRGIAKDMPWKDDYRDRNDGF